MNFEVAAKIVEECCNGAHLQNGETVQAWSVVDAEIERLRSENKRLLELCQPASMSREESAFWDEVERGYNQAEQEGEVS